MQTQDYPLIFVVEENLNYNKIIVNHLSSNKGNRIESFHSEEECLKNLFRKPNIVIQDYLMNEISGNAIINESEKSNLNTKFIFLSDLDNFSKQNNQNTRFTSLSESDKFYSATTVKYGASDYVVKDLSALSILVESFDKTRQNNFYKKLDKISLPLILVTLAALVKSLFS